MKSALVVTFSWIVSCYSIDPNLVFTTNGGTVYTRTLCNTELECTGIGTNVFWSFSGVSNPFEDTETRFSNVTSYTSVGGDTVTISTLTFSPVLPEHANLYNCHIQSKTVTFDVIIDKDIIEVPEIMTVNVSNHKLGEIVTVDLVINTCLSEVNVSVYKGKEKVFGTKVTNNHQSSVRVGFPLLVNSESVGEYGMRVYATETSTPLMYFNVTGSPQEI